MKHLAASRHFQKQLKNLSPHDREKAVGALKSFLVELRKGRIAAGYGFKKINGDKYEFRVDLKIRIAMKLDGDTLVCHLIGNHEAIRRFLKDYRNK